MWRFIKCVQIAASRRQAESGHREIERRVNDLVFDPVDLQPPVEKILCKQDKQEVRKGYHYDDTVHRQ
jgi:predicted TIM-barrel fold metal-dependent hydrolase